MTDSKLSELLTMPIVTVEQVIRFRDEARLHIVALQKENEQLHERLKLSLQHRLDLIQYVEGVANAIQSHVNGPEPYDLQILQVSTITLPEGACSAYKKEGENDAKQHEFSFETGSSGGSGEVPS